MSNHELENFYRGDHNWNEFVEFYREKWIDCKIKEELLLELNDKKDLAIVIFGILENHSLNWIHDTVPLLDGLRPVDCTNNEKLVKRLRVLLTRMPR